MKYVKWNAIKEQIKKDGLESWQPQIREFWLIWVGSLLTPEEFEEALEDPDNLPY